MTDSIKIAIVDDQQIFRQSMARLISSIEGFELVVQAGSGSELLDNLHKSEFLPDILILDMNLPGQDGIEINDRVKERFPHIKTIVLSVHVQDRLVLKMIDAGVSSYLAKNCDIDELITAIKTTHQTGYYINKNVLLAMQRSALSKSKNAISYLNVPYGITDRELMVLKEICLQKSSAEIAESLFLSSRTVEGHRNSLLSKTNSKNSAGLVIFAVKHGIIDVF